LKLEIIKSVYGGYSLAFHNKKAVFVPYAIPGEEVEVEIIKSKKDFSYAKLLTIVKRSPSRIKPQCENFTQCGGCDYLHLNYERELTEKKNIIIDNLTRITHLAEKNIPDIETVSSERFHYRSHASLKNNQGNYGFFQSETNNLIKFPENGCLLLNNKINQSILDITNTDMPEFKIAIDMHSNCFNSLINDTILSEKIGQIIYQRDILSFFQSNYLLREKMLKIVKEYADPSKEQTLLDLGCGVGFFSLYLAKFCQQVSGFDINKK
jgi:23S rRNA (uracil1939-C5)-methyltransferase